MDSEQRTALTATLSSLVVPEIKEIINQLNKRLYLRMHRSGRKSNLIENIVNEAQAWSQNRKVQSLDVLVDAINRQIGLSTFIREDNFIKRNATATPLVYNQIRPPPATIPRSSPSSIMTTQPQQSPLSHPRPIIDHINVQYKSSPFFTLESRLVSPKLCTRNLNTRSSKVFSFSLTAEQQQFFHHQKNSNRGLYQIRFFCSGYDEQNQGRHNEMEFPPICEMKVNTEHTIAGSTLRGMKNKPGTVNPPDITPYCHLFGRKNMVELVYANTVKSYVGTIELVKRRTIPDIVNGLKNSKVISKKETLERLQKRQEDTDIVLESETISTKCPLGFTRIQTPSRSIYCHHLQCFDATTFLLMNEQTPTWSCPVCNRKMESWEEIGVDEYFRDILNSVSNNVESIRIEEGGKIKVIGQDNDESDTDDGNNDRSNIHTNNNTQVKKEIDDSKDATTSVDSVTILDDDTDIGEENDSDDIPLAKRQKITIQRPTIPPPKQNQVIDLTLDSDDEDEVNKNNISSNNNHNGSSDYSDNTLIGDEGRNMASISPYQQSVTTVTSPSSPNTTNGLNSLPDPPRNYIRIPLSSLGKQTPQHPPSSSQNMFTSPLTPSDYSPNSLVLPPLPSTAPPSQSSSDPSSFTSNSLMKSFLHK
ncbi:PINIT domain-containing protein [Halteromyces radiatus]|uniref:PINIT domain-containing protein n=1 Tax=Halteromyces radiatus TaxID=101107 RepID=UPI00221FDA68|nr:PINIT domain-containing protein [Halteromyces radiatus]KAI8089904.1 PINIT domain-containing protein [Halteromyces radiatus]